MGHRARWMCWGLVGGWAAWSCDGVHDYMMMRSRLWLGGMVGSVQCDGVCLAGMVGLFGQGICWGLCCCWVA
jgi:hypothetical protein